MQHINAETITLYLHNQNCHAGLTFGGELTGEPVTSVDHCQRLVDS